MSLFQTTDILRLDGKTYGMIGNPLADTVYDHDIQKKVTIRVSDNWKGYRAAWAVADNRLFLERIEIMQTGKNHGRIKTFEYVPVAVLQTPLFASWFNGEVMIQHDEPWMTSVLGAGDDYDELLKFDHGLLCSRSLHQRRRFNMKKLRGYRTDDE